MLKLYRKSEIWFAVAWIIVYCVLMSVGDSLSPMIGPEKSATALICLVLSAVLFVFLKKNGLFKEYGLCKGKLPGKKVLFYLPLLVLITINLWFGVAMNHTLPETLCYVAAMALVGFLEEMIFRGLLFKAMSRTGLKSAIVVSSLTFGIGHIMRLVNGSGAELGSNLLQVGYAIAIGLLFVTIFYFTGSLLACIAAHSGMDVASVFANDQAIIPKVEVILSVVLVAVCLAYTLYLYLTLRKKPAA